MSEPELQMPEKATTTPLPQRAAIPQFRAATATIHHRRIRQTKPMPAQPVPVLRRAHASVRPQSNTVTKRKSLKKPQFPQSIEAAKEQRRRTMATLAAWSRRIEVISLLLLEVGIEPALQV